MQPLNLFPILPHPTGLARLAAESQPAGEGHLIEFKALKARSLLNRSTSKRLRWLTYSINPYRGCEFACRYCYARYTHEFLSPANPNPNEIPPHEAFERRIFIKQNAAWLLEQELRKITPGEEIAIGTATDPYQPIERTARVTRSILEVFARQRGHRIGVVTKSTLIQRDIDLLQEIAEHNHLILHLTITTPDAALARILEPRAPRPDLRLETVLRLRHAGLAVGILCCPLLPGITDSAAAIDSMARHARSVDASFFAANPLFLKPCSRPTYLSFLREHFPTLLPDYAARFATTDFATPAYHNQLQALVKSACHRHNIPQRFTKATPTRNPEGERKLPQSLSAPTQGRLFA